MLLEAVALSSASAAGLLLLLLLLPPGTRVLDDVLEEEVPLTTSKDDCCCSCCFPEAEELVSEGPERRLVQRGTYRASPGRARSTLMPTGRRGDANRTVRQLIQLGHQYNELQEFIRLQECL
jgi:hypothetical protein